MKHLINYHFLGAALALLLLGTLFLSTLSGIESLQAFGNTHYYLFHQLISIGIGAALALIAFFFPLHLLKKFSLIFLLINLALMVAVFLPFLGVKIWGASRWVNIAGISLQPSEFLKITATVYLAAWISARYKGKEQKNNNGFIRIFLPFMALLGVIALLLYFQKDAATLGITSISLLAVYFVAGTPLWHMGLLVLAGAGGALLLVKLEPYRLERFLVFLHPETDPLGIGFQLKQSLLAIGSGGIFGKGLGMSTQKFGFLPQAMSDSIFAIIGEETGIIGCTILILLFVYLGWQAIKIANNSSDSFGKLVTVGIITWLMVQSFINIASSLGLFPLSGIPLPFFSYGGSHIMAELAAIGLLLNISKNG